MPIGASMTAADRVPYLLLAVYIFVLLGSFVYIGAADAGVDKPNVGVVDNSAFIKQIEDLKARKSDLEFAAGQKDEEIKKKEQVLSEKQQALHEKDETIEFLKNEIEAIKSKGAGDLEAETAKAWGKVKELQKKVETLEESLRQKQQKEASLKLQAGLAEKAAKDHSSKYEKLQQIVDEQKARMEKAEQTLKNAEKKLKKLQDEARSKHEQLEMARNAWLPTWFAAHVAKAQVFIESFWQKHGKPTVYDISNKASKAVAGAHEMAKPHLETVKTTWAPAVKEHWKNAVIVVAPHVKTVKDKAIENYEITKDFAMPHIVKAHETIKPHIEMVKEQCAPYVDQAIATCQPHVEKARIAMQPYTKHVSSTYRQALTVATTYHHKLQKSLMDTLKQNEFTESLATKDLVWFLASALLAMPAFILLKMISSLFGSTKKSSKATRSGHGGHAHKKHNKRRHVDK